MLDELRDGGEARPFKTVLTLPERESEREKCFNSQSFTVLCHFLHYKYTAKRRK